MERSHADAGHDAPAQIEAVRRNHRPYFNPLVEEQLQRLYDCTMAEPVPVRLLTILRTAKV